MTKRLILHGIAVPVLAAFVFVHGLAKSAEAVTYTSIINAPIGPNAGDLLTDTISVPDNFIITQMVIALQLEHTWVGDLTITVEHAGDTITLVDRPGVPPGGIGNNDNLVMSGLYTFADSAAIGIPETSTPGGVVPTGTYLPDPTVGDTFAALFVGDNIAGDWTLRILDNFNGDAGQIRGWQIRARGTEVPEPTSLLLLGAGLLGLARRRRKQLTA